MSFKGHHNFMVMAFGRSVKWPIVFNSDKNLKGI